MAISEQEQQRRRTMIAEIRHQGEIDGGRSSDDFRALQDRWVRGEIDMDTLIEETQHLVATTDRDAADTTGVDVGPRYVRPEPGEKGVTMDDLLAHLSALGEYVAQRR